MDEELKLPGSSFQEVIKIIKGYSHASPNAGLGDIAKLVGMDVTIISRNNKFLAEIGVISGGMKKSVSELGKKLGRALDHNQSEDSKNCWREAVQSSEKLAGLVTTVRIKGGMSEVELSDHILYISGQKNNAGNRTGSRTIVDVLVASGLVSEDDGKINVAIAPPLQNGQVSSEKIKNALDSLDAETGSGENIPPSPPQTISNVPSVNINIQLQLPETENAEIYERLFRALRQELLKPKDD